VVHDTSCHAVDVWTVRDSVRRESSVVAAMPLPRLDMLANSGFVLISRPHAALTGRDPLAQALSDVVTPRVVADVEALVRRRQTLVGEHDRRPVTVGGDVEAAARADPLALLRDEVEVPIGELPHDTLAGHKLGCALLGEVDVGHEVVPVGAEPVGGPDDVGRAPPRADVDDRVVRLLRGGVDGDGVAEVVDVPALLWIERRSEVTCNPLLLSP
jgi:hypothetical protein